MVDIKVLSHVHHSANWCIIRPEIYVFAVNNVINPYCMYNFALHLFIFLFFMTSKLVQDEDWHHSELPRVCTYSVSHLRVCLLTRKSGQNRSILLGFIHALKYRMSTEKSYLWVSSNTEIMITYQAHGEHSWMNCKWMETDISCYNIFLYTVYSDYWNIFFIKFNQWYDKLQSMT